GLREKFVTVKDAYPVVATKAAWIASCDFVYDTACESLQLNSAKLDTYTVKPVGLKHVSGGAQLVKVADKSRVFFHGATSDGAWLTLDQRLWLMRYRRKLQGLADDWAMTFAATDLHYMDAMAKLAAILQEYKGSETVPTQSNYTFEVVQENAVGSTP